MNAFKKIIFSLIIIFITTISTISTAKAAETNLVDTLTSESWYKNYVSKYHKKPVIAIHTALQGVNSDTRLRMDNVNWYVQFRHALHKKPKKWLILWVGKDKKGIDIYLLPDNAVTIPYFMAAFNAPKSIAMCEALVNAPPRYGLVSEYWVWDKTVNLANRVAPYHLLNEFGKLENMESEIDEKAGYSDTDTIAFNMRLPAVLETYSSHFWEDVKDKMLSGSNSDIYYVGFKYCLKWADTLNIQHGNNKEFKKYITEKLVNSGKFMYTENKQNANFTIYFDKTVNTFIVLDKNKNIVGNSK